MMTLRDSIQLASAKLKTHRVRTGIILAIASLLFAGIVLVLTMLTGAARSMQSFGNEGLGSRYIVQAAPIYDYGVLQVGTKEMNKTFAVRSATLKAEKSAEAKRLGVSYDPQNDYSLPMNEYKDPSGTTSMLNTSNPEVVNAMKQYFEAMPQLGFKGFSSSAKDAGATGVFRSTNGYSMLSNPYNSDGGSALVVPIIKGEEQQNDSNQGGYSEPRGVGTLTTLGWTYFDSSLLKPFVLPGQDLSVGDDGAIPVIAPLSAVEQLLELKSLPSTATSNERLDRLTSLRKEIAGKTFSLCYRNSASVTLLSNAKSQAEDLSANKGKAGYVAPSLQYAEPVTACGPVSIVRDVRSAAEKQQATNEQIFSEKYEGYEAPYQGLLKVRIVGFTKDLSYSSGFSARSILESILQSSLGQGWFSPIDAIKEGSIAARIQPPIDDRLTVDQTYYAEFASLDGAKNFAEQMNCKGSADQGYGMPVPGKEDPFVTKCYDQGKYFSVGPYGNNASAIADLRNAILKVARYVAPVILTISSLVLMGIVGKIIADSRRETAVFRALGATRFTIAQIYLTYSLFIATFIAAVAFALGLLVSAILSAKFAPDASVTAVLAYNAQDVHKQFTFFGFDPLYVGIIVGLIVLSALLSTILPLLTNIRRNPIRDMRDES